jgi:hypothetical protein
MKPAFTLTTPVRLVKAASWAGWCAGEMVPEFEKIDDGVDATEHSVRGISVQLMAGTFWKSSAHGNMMSAHRCAPTLRDKRFTPVSTMKSWPAGYANCVPKPLSTSGARYTRRGLYRRRPNNLWTPTCPAPHCADPRRACRHRPRPDRHAGPSRARSRTNRHCRSGTAVSLAPRNSDCHCNCIPSIRSYAARIRPASSPSCRCI